MYVASGIKMALLKGTHLFSKMRLIVSLHRWRVISAMFLHAGIIHLLLNLLFQVLTGFQLERRYGWWRIAPVYLLSGAFGFMFGLLFADPLVRKSHYIFHLLIVE